MTDIVLTIVAALTTAIPVAATAEVAEAAVPDYCIWGTLNPLGSNYDAAEGDGEFQRSVVVDAPICDSPTIGGSTNR